MAAFRYRDRADAGKQLAKTLATYANASNLLILALPRGGVPVAFEVATQLPAPLDAYVVRKLGVPGHEELAMGAVAGDGTVVLDERLIESLGITQIEFDAVVSRELEELHRRENLYRDGRPKPDVTGKTVIIIDDGLATGSTMRAAAIALRRRAPASIVIAVPAAAARTCAELTSVAEAVVCSYTPEPFYAVGLYYQDFRQTTDDEVRKLLRDAEKRVLAVPMEALHPDQIDTNKTPILDVRMRPERKQITGAVHYDPKALLEADPLVLPLPRDAPIAVYGDSEPVVAAVIDKLHRSGYTEAARLEGGIEAWQDAGFPLQDTTQEQPVPGEGESGIPRV